MMKKQLTLLINLFIPFMLLSQCQNPEAASLQDGNNIETVILNGGDLFWKGPNGHFIAPANDPTPKSSIYVAGLWMGGFDEGGSLKIAAQTYGRIAGSFDYGTGFLTDIGVVDETTCLDFDRIWKCTQADIDAHKADFADNGIIDNPIQSIFEWPGRSNPHFVVYTGFFLPELDTDYAPFYDVDGNNIYNPEKGDYPHPPKTIKDLVPASINWTVFHDAVLHTQSNSVENIRAEVQLTSWSFDCFTNPQLNNTIFTSHRIINKNIEAIDSFHVALWTDFDLGCYTDDYIGSNPAFDAFFAYNADNLDGEASADDCGGVNTYGKQTPAQSIQFLNQSMDYFTYYNNVGIGTPPPPGTNDPNNARDYYNYMTGSWQDGTQMTFGGDGYNPQSTEFTNHAFTGNPNNPDEWSMYQEGLPNGDRRTVASTKVGRLDPMDEVTIDIAYTFHQYSSISDHLAIVDQMYDDIEKVQQMYDMRFNTWCSVTTDTEELSSQQLKISPNPSTGIFNLTVEQADIQGLKLFDVSGRLLWQDQESNYITKRLDFGYLSNGIYMLQIETTTGIIPKKLVISSN